MLRMHGTKNSFYIIDEEIDDLKGHTIELCKDGTDGVLYVFPSDKGIAKMRIFNRDGTEPEMCGNGLRCFARYIFEKENIKSGKIETLNEVYDVKYIDDFYGIIGIEIKLSPVYKLTRDEIKDYNNQFNNHFEHFTVSNPHVAAYYDGHMDIEDLTDHGVYANEHFKDGMNVNIIHVIKRGEIYVQTYERGVGITKSCGTGMTSSSVKYARDHDYFDEDILVYNDGGMIVCRVVEEEGCYSVYFTGNATYYDQDDDLYEDFFEQTRKALKDA